MAQTAPAQGAGPPQLQPHQPHSGRKPGDRHSYYPAMFHKVTPAASPPTCGSRSRATSESQAGLEPPQAPNPPASISILRRKVLSKETVKQYQEKALQRQASRGQKEDPARSATCQPAVQIPWEKEASTDRVGVGVGLGPGPTGVRPERGLLEEIDSMCSLGSVVDSSQAPDQGQEQPQ